MLDNLTTTYLLEHLHMLLPLSSVYGVPFPGGGDWWLGEWGGGWLVVSAETMVGLEPAERQVIGPERGQAWEPVETPGGPMHPI